MVGGSASDGQPLSVEALAQALVVAILRDTPGACPRRVTRDSRVASALELLESRVRLRVPHSAGSGVCSAFGSFGSGSPAHQARRRAKLKGLE